MSGFIYCLTNPSFPGLVKIGKTANDPEIRAAQLGASSGVPTKFNLAWSLPVADANAAEAALHDALSPYRVNKRREFFKCTPAQAMARTRSLDAFHVRKSRKKRSRRETPRSRQGLVLATVTVATVLFAIQFDLEPSTVVTATAGLCLAATALFWLTDLRRRLA